MGEWPIVLVIVASTAVPFFIWGYKCGSARKISRFTYSAGTLANSKENKWDAKRS